jgi:subfamily B ATP-binding cassette protein MsbA
VKELDKLDRQAREDLARLTRLFLKHRTILAAAIVSAILSSLFLGGAISLVKPLVSELVGASETAQQPADASSEARAASDAAPSADAPPPSDPLRLDFVETLQARADRAIEPLRRWLLDEGYVRIPLAIIVLYVLKGLFGFVSVYGLNAVSLRVVRSLRSRLYKRVIGQSDAFFARLGNADVLARILGDVSRIQGVLSREIVHAIQSVPIIIVLMTVALIHAWEVTTVCVITIPLFVGTTGRFGRRIKKAARRTQERTSRLIALLEETLLARRVVQAFQAEDYETERFDRQLGEMYRQQVKVARATAATPPVLELIGALVGAAIIIFAGSLMRSGTVTGNDVLVAILALFLVFSRIRRLGHLYGALQQGLASARRVFAVLDDPRQVEEKPNAGPLAPFRDAIQLENVTYSYGREPVLRGVDLCLRRDEAHALVGPSGAGKSTLAMLIPRFADPTSGAVRVDGVDIRDVTLSSLRSQVALVTQETHLFDDTVLANIAYGQPNASEAAIREAARLAHVEDFVDAFPQGFRTRLGERGTFLSAGQRQRIAIARAFLKDAPILILDEPTSALDTESEHAVQVALLKLLEGRTALIIAHRLTTVTHVDRIHVLGDGRIIESGSHDALLGSAGAYARLYGLQAQRLEKNPERGV